MKKVLCLLTALMLCFAMAIPAYAEEFVPSIGYKDEPDVEGNPVLVEGDTRTELDADCLVITPVSDAQDKKEEDRNDAEKLLVDVYAQLSDGSMKLPFETGKDMVIRDLVDASLVCGDVHTDPSHVEALAKEGVMLEVTFDLGVEKDVNVVVMTYIDGKWAPIEKVTNNGDGTVTCLFEEICPVVFCVGEADVPKTGDSMMEDMMVWLIIFAVSLIAIAVLVVLRKKNLKRAK